jgi:hypothetical protein
MEDKEILYPVLSLNQNITNFLQKVISADIFDTVKSGLNNEVKFMDKGTHITGTLKIERCDDGVSSQVFISAAYCQYFWLLCDVMLKVLDRRVIASACAYYGITLDDFYKSVEETNKKEKNEVLPFVPDWLKPDIERYLAYLQIVPDLLAPDFWEKMGWEYMLAESLRDNRLKIELDEINKIDMKEEYSERTNSVYSYGMAFCMLHELVHHQLKHLDKPEERNDEVNADAKAFWSIYRDIKGEERFTANTGMLCVFLSFMMMNPQLKEDGIHPREDERLFTVYDKIVKENPKYTLLLVNILDFWAKMCKNEDYPKDLEPVEESVVKIKKYFGLL